jgi:ubiquinol-cytochrome c reductase cytochrome c1 subunit
MRKYIAALLLGLVAVSSASAADDVEHPKQEEWSFDGALGKFDRASIQRGYKVYKEVCAACHSVKRVAFRNLQEIGFSEAEVKAIAASYSVVDGPNDEGEMFERPGKPFDYLPEPYPNEQAARAANNNALPPDLSLIVKARHDGANYVYSLLTGYQEPPEDFKMIEGLYYNPYFAGGGKQFAMTSPLTSAGLVEYDDGTEATIDQMARDVVNFLQWAAEPEMEGRKALGMKSMLFMVLFTGLFIVAKRRVWKRVK